MNPSRLIRCSLSTLAVLTSHAVADLVPLDLRCEGLEGVPAVDAAPGLSWRVESTDRGQRQSAWQVLVASSEALLAEGKADLWDSGKVSATRSPIVTYAGRKLAAGQRCHWKVRSGTRTEKSPPGARPRHGRSPRSHPPIGRARAGSTTASRSRKTTRISTNRIPPRCCARNSPWTKPVVRATPARRGPGLRLHKPQRRAPRRPGARPAVDEFRQAHPVPHPRCDLLSNQRSELPRTHPRQRLVQSRCRCACGAVETSARPCPPAARASSPCSSSSIPTAPTPPSPPDPDWKTTEGPTVRNSVFLGEERDARLGQTRLGQARLRCLLMETRARHRCPARTAQAHPRHAAGARDGNRLPAVAVTTPAKGTYIVDFGTNFTGLPEIKLNVPAGTAHHAALRRNPPPRRHAQPDDQRLRPDQGHAQERQGRGAPDRRTRRARHRMAAGHLHGARRRGNLSPGFHLPRIPLHGNHRCVGSTET